MARDHVFDPGGGVGTDQPQPPTSFGAKLLKEALQSRFIAALGGPDQTSGVVVNHDGDVLLTLAIADLVDADSAESVHVIRRRSGLRDHSTDHPADRSPGHSQQLRDGGPRGVDGKPGRLILEGAGEACAMTGPRYGLHDDPMLRAPHSRRLAREIGRDGAEVERAPIAGALSGVIATATSSANAASAAALSIRRYLGDHCLKVLVIVDLLDDRLLDAEQAAPYTLRAHAEPSLPELGPRQTGFWQKDRRAFSRLQSMSAKLRFALVRAKQPKRGTASPGGPERSGGGA